MTSKGMHGVTPGYATWRWLARAATLNSSIRKIHQNFVTKNKPQEVREQNEQEQK
jgi:hypothetical protein